MGNELYRHCLREENKMTKFKDLGLKEEVLRGITDQGFEEAFEIQEAVIPLSTSSFNPRSLNFVILFSSLKQ